MIGINIPKRVEKENAIVNFAQKLHKISFVQNVPPERFEGEVSLTTLQGECDLESTN